MSEFQLDLAAIKRFFTSSHVLHLEREIEHLRGQNAMLHLELMGVLKPTPAAPAPPRQFPKFTPAKTSWESYVAEQMALQEVEETNATTPGTRSNGTERTI